MRIFKLNSVLTYVINLLIDFRTDCTEGQYQCAEPHNRCIREEWVCDGEQDCEDGGDELNCNGTYTAYSKNSIFV